MKFIKKVPLPMSGLMLACFAVANLLKSYHDGFHTVFSWSGVVLFALITLKIILEPKALKVALEHPVVSSVLPTYSMGMMLMAAFLKPMMTSVSPYIWYTAIIIHMLLMINYTIKFVLKFDLKKIFPSIFIVYVGIVTASVTAPAFNITMGKLAFYFGMVVYVFLIVLVAIRLKKHKQLPAPAQPTLAIIAAPASLCLAGYMSCFSNPSKPFVMGLMMIALLMTVLVYTTLPKLLKLSFSPGYAAFTFPLVISAIAVKKANVLLQSNGVSFIITLETIIATVMVLYVLIRYVHFLTKNTSEKKIETAA